MPQADLKQMNDELRAAETERGYEGFAAAFDGAAHGLVEFRHCIGEGGMRAVAVGAFADQHIRGRNRMSALEDRLIAAAEIAGEAERFFPLRRISTEVNNGRAEHVAGFDVAEPQAAADLGFLLVRHGHQSREDAIDIVVSVKRLHPRLGVVAGDVQMGRVLFLNLRRIA